MSVFNDYKKLVDEAIESIKAKPKKYLNQKLKKLKNKY